MDIGNVYQLAKQWTVEDSIGSGGFGSVWLVSDPEGNQAALKIIPKAPGAKKELLFVNDLPESNYIIPTIDSGETKEAYLLVMPKAEKSLRDYLDNNSSLSREECFTIAQHILRGLESVHSTIVHRDIKPDNILLYNGFWCISDFGISRYLETSTSPDTKKQALSHLYAAPERWTYERAVPATDIYSWAIIFYELFYGELLIEAETVEECRDFHINGLVPPMDEIPNTIRGCVIKALNKEPTARPSIQRILEHFEEYRKESMPSIGITKLQSINVAAEIESTNASVHIFGKEKMMQIRRNHLVVAQNEYTEISNRLRSDIKNNLNDVKIVKQPLIDWEATFQQGKLSMSTVVFCEVPVTNEYGDNLPFDVICAASITAEVKGKPWGRSHSLWYGNIQNSNEYGWFEVSFMDFALSPQKSHPYTPFSLPPSQSSGAFSMVVGEKYQLAKAFVSLHSVSAQSKFRDYWLQRFVDAINNTMNTPSQLPEDTHDAIKKSWKKSK